jgi:hypothetical protein
VGDEPSEVETATEPLTVTLLDPLAVKLAFAGKVIEVMEADAV